MPSTARHKLRCGPGGSRYTAIARLSRLYMADSGHRDKPSGLYMAFRHGNPVYARWNSSAHTRGSLVEVPYIRHLANSSRWNLPYIGEVAPSAPRSLGNSPPYAQYPIRATPPTPPANRQSGARADGSIRTGPAMEPKGCGRSGKRPQPRYRYNVRRSSASEWSATW